jgi:hypothetical protein
MKLPEPLMSCVVLLCCAAGKWANLETNYTYKSRCRMAYERMAREGKSVRTFWAGASKHDQAPTSFLYLTPDHHLRPSQQRLCLTKPANINSALRSLLL